MAKDGMRRDVYHHKDPTYEAVLAKFRKESRESAEKNRAMAAFRVFATVKLILRISGYRLLGELVIEDERSGAIYRHGKGHR